MQDEALSYIQMLRYGVAQEITAVCKYYLYYSTLIKSDPPQIKRIVWKCRAKGCQANFVIRENQERYNVESVYSIHTHHLDRDIVINPKPSKFLGTYVNHLLMAGLPTATILRHAYADLNIDIIAHPYPFLTLSKKAIELRKVRRGLKFKFDENELISLQIFTNAMTLKHPEDFNYYRASEEGFIWAYGSKKGKEIAQISSEWHLDSTYAVTSRRTAVYVLVSNTEIGHGFPLLYCLVEPDNATTLTEILQAYRTYLGDIKLQTIVSDCAKQEELAIKQTFGDKVGHRWCGFHVMRAIKANYKKFNLRNHYDRFFDAMRCLSCLIMTNDQINLCKKQIEDSLRNEPAARLYYSRTWSNCEARWIFSFQTSASRTNNYSEGHFKALKYRYLGHRQNYRLDELAVRLVTEIIPDMQLRYLNDQIQAGRYHEILAEAAPITEQTTEEMIREFTDEFRTSTEKIVEGVRAGKLDAAVVLATMKHLLGS